MLNLDIFSHLLLRTRDELQAAAPELRRRRGACRGGWPRVTAVAVSWGRKLEARRVVGLGFRKGMDGDPTDEIGCTNLKHYSTW